MKSLGVALLLLGLTPALGQEARPYAPLADAQAAHAAALVEARRLDRHLWVQISDASCPLCERLHWVIEAHPETSEPLRRDFLVLHPAVGRANIPLFRAWGSPHLEQGVPLILILDAKGAVLTVNPVKAFADATGELDVEKIAAFMRQWTPAAVRERAAAPEKSR